MTKEAKEACGVFGVHSFSPSPAFPYLYWGLRSQNHRGHQSHGFLSFNGRIHEYKSLDLVPRIRGKEVQDWLEKLPGHVGIGHVRYSTSGGTDEQSLVKNTQPILIESGGTGIGISFNGNVVNTSQLELMVKEESQDVCFKCDAELICRKLLNGLKRHGDIASSVRSCIEDVEGAFSIAGLTKDGELFAFKDTNGIRPLCCGYNDNHDVYAVSSETVGLGINGLEQSFEIEPGELVIASKCGFLRENLANKRRKALCGFEFAYFSRPDSMLGNIFVYEAREEFGRNLAKEYSDDAKNADLIISMPETGDDAAFGLHEATGVRWERAVRRHRYVTDRAFIMLPDERYTTIDRKMNILSHKISGKNVIVVDDSIVRGDTTKTVLGKLRNMGAKKVYLFITFPRIIGPCFYGVDMATYGELIGAKYEPQEIAEMVGADAVNYQSLSSFVQATGLREDELCLGCITGQYPTPLAQKMADEMKYRFEKGHRETGRIYEVMN